MSDMKKRREKEIAFKNDVKWLLAELLVQLRFDTRDKVEAFLKFYWPEYTAERAKILHFELKEKKRE